MRTLLSFSLVIIIFLGHLFVPPTGAQERGVGIVAPLTGRYHALVIGNNAYQMLPKLQTAENDAREVEKLLKDSYGFRTKLLLNATRGQIVAALASYRRDLMPDDNLIVYYAGHGYNDAEAGRAYWLPVDATKDDSSNWISADDITAGTRTIPAKHVLVISDSCYSGTLTRGLGDMLPRPTEREQFLRKMQAGKSRTLMASGGNEPVADGGGGGHSVFANALLRGLREMDKGQFTAAELFRYHVEESVAGRANQTPEYNPLRNSGHESGDFVFVKIKTDGKKVEVTVKAPTTTAGDRAISNTAANPPPTTDAVGSSSAVRPEAGAVVRSRMGVELVYVPPGEFMMGSENGGAGEKPVHRVTIREGFYLGKYEVTQAQWQMVMGSSFIGCDTCPVEQVTWNDTQSFIQKLNERNDGFTYRLPSEAEWEYACRAGSTRDHAGYLDAMAWYEANSGKQTHPVGQKQPNGFGLYDMHGNVWEWVQDSWRENYHNAPTDGSAWLSGGDSIKRVIRGGSWYNNASALRSAVRSGKAQSLRTNTVGFRVVAAARTS